MATLNYGTKELICKVVYYGPAYGGKTTNLIKIHDRLPADSRGDLTSLATNQERTLYFDLLPVNLGKIGDYFVKVQFYTVPGQVRYNATRRVVLNGVDGIVMVFDSDPERENANYIALANLEENLAYYDLDIATFPTVFQYNKRDLDKAMAHDFMSQALNPEGHFPEVEAIATDGTGVPETMKKICSMVFERLENDVVSRSKIESSVSLAREGARSPMPTGPSRPTERPAGAVENKSPKSKEKRRRIRQLCDLRHSGLLVGHAILDLVEGAAQGDSPDWTAELDLEPALGKSRRENVDFWRAEAPGSPDPSVEFYEARESVKRGIRPKLWRVYSERGASQLFLDWPARIGKMLILPEGRTRLPNKGTSPGRKS